MVDSGVEWLDPNKDNLLLTAIRPTPSLIAGVRTVYAGREWGHLAVLCISQDSNGRMYEIPLMGVISTANIAGLDPTYLYNKGELAKVLVSHINSISMVYQKNHGLSVTVFTSNATMDAYVPESKLKEFWEFFDET